MNEDIKRLLGEDTDGLLTYEYIANHIDSIDDIIDELVDNMIAVDLNGQFTVSAARYLYAIDKDKYNDAISRLIGAAIIKDREDQDALYGLSDRGLCDVTAVGQQDPERLFKGDHPRCVM